MLIEREDIITFRQYLDKTVSQSLHEIKSLLLSSRPHPLSFLTYLTFSSQSHSPLTPGQAPKKPKRATNKTPHLLTPPPTLAPPVEASFPVLVGSPSLFAARAGSGRLRSRSSPPKNAQSLRAFSLL